MERPTLEESRQVFLKSSINTRENAYSLYSKEQDKYIDQIEAERKSERKEANQFIIQIAELLGIDADGIGYDGLQLSIDDFKEAINKLGKTVIMEWISVKDRPLYEIDNAGNWICTKDGDNEFIAAVPYVDTKRPGNIIHDGRLSQFNFSRST